LTSALERPIRNPTSQSFASEVFHVALASAKGHPRRSCLDDLSRHSRLLHLVVICDSASDLKRANAIGNQWDLLSTFKGFSAVIRRPLHKICALERIVRGTAQFVLQPAVEIGTCNRHCAANVDVHMSSAEG
jgi:hypothetical protein